MVVLKVAIWVSGLIATFVHVTLVMHQYFPSEVFKYIAITAGILIILGFLISVLKRQVVRKPADLNLKAVADSYSARKCTRCAFPFQLRLRADVTGGRAGAEAAIADHEPYTCPSCGTNLFSECTSCGATRHTLLSHCGTCGASDAPEPAPTPA